MVQPRNEATHSDSPSPSTEVGAPTPRQAPPKRVGLPRGALTVTELEELLRDTGGDERRGLMVEILCFAPWEDLWRILTPQEVGEELGDLDLPQGLKTSWSRWLEATTPEVANLAATDSAATSP